MVVALVGRSRCVMGLRFVLEVHLENMVGWDHLSPETSSHSTPLGTTPGKDAFAAILLCH